MYIHEYDSTSSIPDEPGDIRCQIRQKASDLIGLLQQLAHNGPDASLLPALSAITEATTPPQCDQLSSLQKHDMEAYKLFEYAGVKQSQIAVQLNAEHHTTYSQGQVSKMIHRARAHVRAMGFQPALQRTAPALSVDPARLNMGARTDGRRTGDSRSRRRPTDA